MGKWIHVMTGIDKEAMTGHCAHCGMVRVRRKGKRLLCSKGANKWPGGKGKKKRYRASVSLICERCRFVAVHRCQIDKHHIDGNHENNEPSNLENICANCHRLQSHEERRRKFGFLCAREL